MADASHAAAELTVQEYITHHLSFLTFGRIDGHWGFAHTPEEAAEMGFWAINVDTFGWSLFLGAGFLWFFSSLIFSFIYNLGGSFVCLINDCRCIRLCQF